MDLRERLHVTAVDHVGIAVPDLDAAIAFQTEVLGGVLEHRERNDVQGVEEAVITFGGTGADRARLQLLAPLTADSAIGRFLDRSGPGLQQLAFRVPDVRVAADTLRAAGLRVLYDEPAGGTAGSLVNFVHPKDAGGVLLELVQPRSPDSTSGDGNMGT
jgi:methylmalonyl-CoA/ethylmalonyl-CoA epimerase